MRAFAPPQTVLAVFVPMSTTDFVRLRSGLYDVVKFGPGSGAVYPLCAKRVNGIESVGRPTEAADAKDVVVVV